MSIYAYDPVNFKVNYNKTYIDFKNNFLCSREFKIKKYVFVGTRYNTSNENIEVFVVFTDEPPENNAICHKVSKDVYGRVKIHIPKEILKQVIHEKEVMNVNISVDDESDDCIAYKILEY